MARCCIRGHMASRNRQRISVLRPDLLLVPLLLFDGRGHRLGYGGGFYDRTIALLGVPAFGIAYAGQEVFQGSLPAEAHDIALMVS